MTSALQGQALPLPAAPQSVSEARVWVSGMLKDLGRDDLTDAAELGVSELVTNAILHADPPILVRVRGTRRHPRVEVHDHSCEAPMVARDITDERHLMSTVGRGLGIVALYSSTWGAEVSADGKVVWFEPAAEADLDADGRADFTLDLLDDAEPPVAPYEQMRVVLLGLPVQRFARFRTWSGELRRELRLLALSHGADYPVAKELSDLTAQLETERRHAMGVEVLDRAVAEGVERLDVTLTMPVSAPATMATLLDILDRADRFCREQRLLAVASTPQQVALRQWYLGEFVRQGAGEAPVAWPGGYQAL
jgi:anti-sigma regulatory factor (Ser/Thr protein kinase)